MTLATHEVRWAAGNRFVVDGVTLRAAPGRVLGLIGPNGSGKSSLLRLICRLRRVASGVVTLDGADVAALRPRDFARRVAFVEQQAAADLRLSVREVVRLGRTPHRGPLAAWSPADEAALAAALRRVDMADREGQLWHTLSGGERQRVHIARALAQEPSELVLDEPTNHLDIRHQLDVLALVRRLGVTAIVALHDLNLAALFCDEIAAVQAGRLVACGSPDEVLTEDILRDVFGVEAEIRVSPVTGRRRIEYRIDTL